MSRRHSMQLADKQDWFPVEYRIVKPDGSVRWLAGGAEVVARLPDGRAARLVNVVGDITDRKLAEQHTELVMRELTHRAKNLLAVILSIATQTGRNTQYGRGVSRTLFGAAAGPGRVARPAGASQLARRVDRRIANSQLAPFVDAGTDRLHLSGPEITGRTGHEHAHADPLVEAGSPPSGRRDGHPTVRADGAQPRRSVTPSRLRTPAGGHRPLPPRSPPRVPPPPGDRARPAPGADRVPARLLVGPPPGCPLPARLGVRVAHLRRDGARRDARGRDRLLPPGPVVAATRSIGIGTTDHAERRKARRVVVLLAIGTLPAAVVGFTFESTFKPPSGRLGPSPPSCT